MDAQLQRQARVTTEKLSFQDYLKAYDSFEGGRTEWLAGEVAIYPMTNNTRHQELIFLLAMLFEIFLSRRALGRVLLAGIPMFISDEQPAREPDLMIILTEHLDRIKQTYVDGLADIVVEIISAESVARDRGEKFTEYEVAKVPEYWLIDPQRTEMRIYALNANGVYHAVEQDEQGRLRSTVLSNFVLDPSILWSEQLPRYPQVITLIEQME
jgi:Uma2 family endonuclease